MHLLSVIVHFQGGYAYVWVGGQVNHGLLHNEQVYLLLMLVDLG